MTDTKSRYVMVPREPTEAMIEAVAKIKYDRLRALTSDTPSDKLNPGGVRQGIRDEWAAMLAAAPTPDAAPEAVAWMAPGKAEIFPASTIDWYRQHYGPDCQTVRDYSIPLYTRPAPPSETRPAESSMEAKTALGFVYDHLCAMDNSDEPLEAFPQRMVDALAGAGWAVVPCELPPKVLGTAAMMGETGNPKFVWDHLIGQTRIYPRCAPDASIAAQYLAPDAVTEGEVEAAVVIAQLEAVLPEIEFGRETHVIWANAKPEDFAANPQIGNREFHLKTITEYDARLKAIRDAIAFLAARQRAGRGDLLPKEPQ